MYSIKSRATDMRALRTLLVTALLVFLLTLASAALADEDPAQDKSYPTDEEVAATLEPEILSETRSGDATTITISIPVGADTFTSSGQPNTNWSNDPNLRVGFNTLSGLGAERIYLYFNVNSIPSNATIQSAEVRAFVNSFSPLGDSPMGVQARFLTTFWDPTTLTWNNYNPQWGSAFGTGQVPAAAGEVVANIPNVVGEWVSGARPNYGFILIGDETPQQRERVFWSLNANNGLFPRLVVTYQIDTTPPVATVEPLPQFSPVTFQVRWSGNDGNGSGIRNYDVQYRVPNGNWTNWVMNTTATSANFTGSNGIQYQFRARATDNANNTQAWSANAQASTTVDTIPPSVTVAPLPQFTFQNFFTITWGGTDNLSGIARYDVEYQANGGQWQTVKANTTDTSAQVTLLTPGVTYGFRARGIDNVGNVQPWSSVAQASTTISLGNPSARILPFPAAVTNQTTFLVQWTGTAASGANITSYDVRYRFNEGPWQSWLNTVAASSGNFNALQGDGVYEFQVRSRDSVGRVSEWSGGQGNSIAVDAVAPFIQRRSFEPVIKASE